MNRGPDTGNTRMQRERGLRGAILRGDGMKEMRTLTNDKREGRRETRENSRDTARGETECLLRDREEW